MKIFNIKKSIKDNYALLEADILPKNANKPFTLWFKFPKPIYKDLVTRPEPFVAATLLECMYEKEDLYVKGSLSNKLFYSLPKIMDFLNMGDENLHHIKVKTDKTSFLKMNGRSIGCFFSGGVDSFYSLLKNLKDKDQTKGKINKLIVIRGFDIALDKSYDWLWEKTSKNAKKVAKKLGIETIEVTTNIKEHTELMEDWRKQPIKRHWVPSLFGSLLSAVGLTLQNTISIVYIPSGLTYKDLMPHGSHPLLDPLWSTESLEVIHDGCEANRFEKINREIIKNRMALNNLRVCINPRFLGDYIDTPPWENRDKEFNCGDCEKCLRTLVCFDILGGLDKATTFKNHLAYKSSLNKLVLDTSLPYEIPFWQEISKKAEKYKRDGISKIINSLIERSNKAPTEIISKVEIASNNV
jgi:hypothetical protein